MNKWLKRIAVAAVALVIGAVVGLLVLRYLAHRRPDWYPSAALDSVSLAKAQRSLEDKFSSVRTWAAETTAREQTQASGREPVATDAPEPPARSSTLTLSDAEFNALFAKWDKGFNWSDRFADYMSNPVLILRDGRIILAANVKQLDTLVSVHLEPSLDDKGQLHLDVARVMGGSLPLPQALWSGYRDRFVRALDSRIDQSRQNARLNTDGTVNQAAVTAAMSDLLLHAIEGKPSEPILFLSNDLDMHHALAVKITSLKIQGQTLTLTVEPLPLVDRKAFVQRLRDLPKAGSTDSADTKSQASASAQ